MDNDYEDWKWSDKKKGFMVPMANDTKELSNQVEPIIFSMRNVDASARLTLMKINTDDSLKQGGFSFPSGHSMIAVCMYGYLIYMVNKKFTNKYLKFISIFMLVVLIISIGLSRVYVGVHYISDVIAGYILALILLILYIELTEKFFCRGK